MRKALAFSAASAVRAVILGGVLSAIFAGPACTRQTFDLLQNATGGLSGTANAGATSSVGGSVAGDTGHGSAGGGGDGRGGASSFGGSGGDANMPVAGSSTQPQCLSGEACVDGGVPCPPNIDSCRRCTTDMDCENLLARFCDVPDGRCAECLQDSDCHAGEVCHPLTKRCLHACKTSTDCADNRAPQCDPFHACVACLNANDCHQLTGRNEQCAFGWCVECYESRQCPMDKPHCVALNCTR